MRYNSSNARISKRLALKWPQICVLSAGLGLAGCGSLSIPLGEFSSTSDVQPLETGLTNISVAAPLPTNLDHSDATIIGRVAARAMLDSMQDDEINWTNATTGSSGRLRDFERTRAAASGLECREFDTTVTSLKGVHAYSGEACPDGMGGFVLRYGVQTAL